jgi:hypothetical protein
MKAGNKIRVQHYIHGYPCGQEDFIVEEFRYCLGIFETEQHRTAARFTPLCDMFERGPESENSYISNFGEYITNQVQAWMDLA